MKLVNSSTDNNTGLSRLTYALEEDIIDAMHALVESHSYTVGTWNAEIFYPSTGQQEVVSPMTFMQLVDLINNAHVIAVSFTGSYKKHSLNVYFDIVHGHCMLEAYVRLYISEFIKDNGADAW